MKQLISLVLFLALASLSRGQGVIYSTDQTGGLSSGGEAGFRFVTNVIGQTFIPGSNSVAWISLRIDETSQPNGVGCGVYVSLYTTSPAGTLLGVSSPMTIPDGYRGGATLFTFTNAIPVEPGAIYYFQVNPLAGSDPSFGVQGGSTITYVRGSMFYNGTVDTFNDLWFREGVIQPAPEPGTLALGALGLTACLLATRRRK